MDPNANLAEQESILTAKVSRAALGYEARRRLTDLRLALSAWLAAGGAEPDWTKARHAARYFGHFTPAPFFSYYDAPEEQHPVAMKLTPDGIVPVPDLSKLEPPPITPRERRELTSYNPSYIDKIIGVYAPDAPGIREAITEIVEAEVTRRLNQGD